jgi:hypothetical protein
MHFRNAGTGHARRGAVAAKLCRFCDEKKERVMSDDHSPGDARKPYSDTGGPQQRHAETHDVRREQLTNPKGPEAVDESFAEDIAPQTPDRVRQQELESEAGDADKQVGNMLPELTSDQLSRLSILEPGTPLEQGSVYLNLSERQSGPFKAIGGQDVGAQDKMIAKSMTDYELWNEIAGRDDDPEIKRPDTE